MNLLGPAARSCLLSLAVVAIASVCAAVATAELYRCERPDGSTVYTDSLATCPGAREHHTTGEVQRYRTTPPPAPTASRRASPARLTDHPQADSEANWRHKKLQAAEDLRAVTARIEKILLFVKTCKRGGSVFRMLENGLRKSVSCHRLRNEVPQLEQQRSALADYLDHGLREECRKSGCLPGWLR